MPIREAVKTAFSLALASLRAHKLRSFLTLLGVIIGVASVVIVGAAIQGFDNYTKETTSKVLGSDGFQVGQVLQAGRFSRRERLEKLRVNERIRLEEFDYLRQTLGDQIYFSTYRQRPEDIKFGEQRLEATIILGCSADLAEIRDVVLVDGRFFTAQEEQNRALVAIIGEDVRLAFFPETSPLGKLLKIGGFEFTIVGVQEKIGSLGGQSQDNLVYIPATMFNRLYGPQNSIVVFARAKPESGLTLDEALDQVRVALRTRFKTPPGAPDNFDTLTPETTRAFIDQILGLITAAVIPVTAISLVVGGIVIMNIMLVSVTERTREIGIRKSLGARQFDLMLQFLLEAVVLSLLGGAIGLGLAELVTSVASVISGVRLPITLGYVLLSVIVSSVVGVVSGWYPARRAARMDPIEALRAE